MTINKQIEDFGTATKTCQFAFSFEVNLTKYSWCYHEIFGERLWCVN